VSSILSKFLLSNPAADRNNQPCGNSDSEKR